MGASVGDSGMATAQAVDNVQLLKEVRAFADVMYDKATAYLKLVLSIGYAGFYTVWSGTKDQMGAGAKISSAGLMTFSVFVYILTEVYQMRQQSLGVVQFNLATANTTPQEVQRALVKFNEDQAKRTRTSMKIFRYVYWPVLAPAVVAATIMLSSFAVRLYHLWIR